MTVSFFPAPMSIAPEIWPFLITPALVVAVTVTSSGHNCGLPMISSKVTARAPGRIASPSSIVMNNRFMTPTLQVFPR